MERLTELLRYWNHSLPEKVDYADLVCAPAFAHGYSMVYEDEYGYMVEDTIKALEELQQYRKLEEDGLLLRLPCKVGDIVYSDSEYFGILPYEVNSVHICIGISFEAIASRDDEMLDAIDFDIEDIGKTVFLTREEAEAKLSEMEGGHE